MTYAAVVLPVPVSRSYIYEVPETLTARVVPGARVVVPLRRRNVVGIVTEAVSDLPSAGVEIKPIIAAPDEEPAISPPLLELGRWMSDYYGAPLGLALRAILPGPLWSVARPAGPAPAAERVLVLTGNGMESLLERERRFKRAPKRRVVYETVEALGGSAPVAHLVKQLKLSTTALEGLVKQGLARIEHVPEIRDPFAGLSTPPPPSLTEDQRRVVEGIRATELRQDARVSGRASCRRAAGERGHSARPGNRADAADGGPGARRVWRQGGGAALRPLRWRARRRMARAAPR